MRKPKSTSVAHLSTMDTKKARTPEIPGQGLGQDANIGQRIPLCVSCQTWNMTATSVIWLPNPEQD
jgi:hypothetical protein